MQGGDFTRGTPCSAALTFPRVLAHGACVRSLGGRGGRARPRGLRADTRAIISAIFCLRSSVAAMNEPHKLADDIFAKRETEIRQGLACDGYFILQGEAFGRCVDEARAEYLAILPSIAMNPQRSQRHGVDCVDLDVLPDIHAATGRLAAFTNFYEILA